MSPLAAFLPDAPQVVTSTPISGVDKVPFVIPTSLETCCGYLSTEEVLYSPPPSPTPTNIAPPMEPIITLTGGAMPAVDAITTKAKKKKKSKAHSHTGTGPHTHTHSSPNAFTSPLPVQIAAATGAPEPLLKKIKVGHHHHTTTTTTTVTPEPTPEAPTITSSPPTTIQEVAEVASSTSKHKSAHSSSSTSDTEDEPSATASPWSPRPTPVNYADDRDATPGPAAPFGEMDPAAEIQSNIQALSALLLRFGELISAGAFLGRQDGDR